VISKKILPACVPTLLEVMRDPHVVVDGFTYEAEAIQGWLNGSNDNSPMTNDKLDPHNLVPNYALRSAIHDWLQNRQNMMYFVTVFNRQNMMKYK